MKSVLLFLVNGLSFLTLCYGATIEFIPFSMELRSTNTNSENGLTEKLRGLTSVHLQNYALTQDNSMWGTVDDLVLSVKEAHVFIAADDGEEESITTHAYSKISFTGYITLVDNTIPTSMEMQSFQRSAFIGQAKLDFLSDITTSNDAFLSSVNDVKISFIESDPKKSSLGTILTASAIGTAFALVAICAFHYFQKMRSGNGRSPRNSRGRGNRLKHLRLEEENDSIPDIELASTHSMSPTNSLNFPLPHSQPGHFDGADSINTNNNNKSSTNANSERKMTKTSSKSVLTDNTLDVNNNVDMLAWKHNVKGDKIPFVTDITGIEEVASVLHTTNTSMNKTTNTIDVNNNVDMLAWKHKKKADDGEVPFETDITMISKQGSPNKTMNVKVISEKSRRKKSSYRNKQQKPAGYLSKDILSQHNGSRFGDKHRS